MRVTRTVRLVVVATAVGLLGLAAPATAEPTPAPEPVGASALVDHTDELPRVRANVEASGIAKAHHAYVAIVTNPGLGTPPTDAAASAIVSQATSYWIAQSQGEITSFATAAAVRFDRTSTTGSCGLDSPNVLWDEAAARFGGVDFSSGSTNHLIVIVSDACNTGGVGTFSSTPGLGSGGKVTIEASGPFVLAHELGHNFGLAHANAELCAGPARTSCTTEEYLGAYDPMSSFGSNPIPALSTAYRAMLGLVGAGEVTAVTSSSVQTLAPRGASSGRRGLVVTDPLTGTEYWVDYRSGAGADVGARYTLDYANTADNGTTTVTFAPGVVIQQRIGASTTVLARRETATLHHEALTAGTDFTSAAGGVRIAVVTTGATATVEVTLATPPVVGPPATPPIASFRTATPRITGTPKVGRTLKVKVGSWSPRPRFTYQWYAGGKKITTKGTKSSLKLTAKQRGKKITVRVTATRPGYATTWKASKPTKKVARR